MSTLTCTVLLFTTALINNAAGACTFPSDIRGTWLSSDRGSLTFNSSHVVDYPVYNQGDLAFECYSLVGNYYILLSEEFTLFSSPAIAVMCVSFTSVKEYMYKYQIFTVALTDADNQRIRFAATGTTVNSALACTDLGATDYYLLMQDGQIESVKEQCPDIFLGTFAFSFNESDCANSTGSLNVCSDLDTMTFNYTTCSTQQAYSSNGSLNCLYSTTSGDVTTLNVYNLDSTTDESSTYRFTCYVIEQPSGSSNVYATQHPKDCHVNQTSTYVPAPGANLTMLASVTCVPTTTTTTTATTTAQAGLIAGVAAGLIVLLLLALLIVGFYCYKKKSKVQPAGKAPIDTDPAELQTDTFCLMTEESTNTPVIENEHDVLAILHDAEFDKVVTKQPKPKGPATISLNGNKGDSLQHLRRNDRQTSIRFTVSNLKKKQPARKAKNDTKVKQTSKPNPPKKQLPWPALFLSPENESRKEKDREKKTKVPNDVKHKTQVKTSEDKDFKIEEEILKEVEQIKANENTQNELIEKQTMCVEDDHDEKKDKDEETKSMVRESYTQETQEEQSLINEILSGEEPVTRIEEEGIGNEKEAEHEDVLREEIVISQHGTIDDNLNENVLDTNIDIGHQSKENEKENNNINNGIDIKQETIVKLENENENDASNNDIDNKQKGEVIKGIIEKKEASLSIKLINNESEVVTCGSTTYEKDDILDEKTSITVTREDSEKDSGVFSNSSSVEPSTDNDPNSPTPVPEDHSENKTGDVEITETQSGPNQTENQEDSVSTLIDTTSVSKPSTKTDNKNLENSSVKTDNTNQENASVKTDNTNQENSSFDKAPRPSQLDAKETDNVLTGIDNERNVYIDMLKDVKDSDKYSRTPRLRPVLLGLMSDENQKDAVVTTRHVILTQKEDRTVKNSLPEHEDKILDKPTLIEREMTQYSIEKSHLPSIGNDKNDRMKQIKDKRLQHKQQRKTKRAALKQTENKVTETLTNTNDVLATENSDSKSFPSSDTVIDDTLPVLVRAPHKNLENNKDKSLSVIGIETTDQVEPKLKPKVKKKKFSFLPTITNASMFAEVFENVDAENMPCKSDSPEIVNHCEKLELEPLKVAVLEDPQTVPTEITVEKTEPEKQASFKLPDSVNTSKPSKMKQISHKPKGLSLPNLTGQKRHSAPEFRLSMMQSNTCEGSLRPESFKETKNTLTVPIQENRALVQGPTDAAWVENESKNKSKKVRKNSKSEKATAKPEKQKTKKASKASVEKPKRKRRRKNKVDVEEDEDDEVDTSKYFDDNERAGKVRPGDKDDLQGLIMRIRENTIVDFGLDNNQGSEKEEGGHDSNNG
ncbi:enolase-phosphatase E1-like [Argopecten irradians]|uniref:enolase-phosphatase E1-like n=1 Tax=Argopecten irradians TaxID=31199 RepID=UPI00371DF045